MCQNPVPESASESAPEGAMGSASCKNRRFSISRSRKSRMDRVQPNAFKKRIIVGASFRAREKGVEVFIGGP